MPLQAGRTTAATILALIALLGAVTAIITGQYRRNRSRELLETVKEVFGNLAAAQEGHAADHAGFFMPPNPRVLTAESCGRFRRARMFVAQSS